MKYIWLALAVVFLAMGLWLCMQTMRCKQSVKARFTDIKVVKGLGMKDYFPVFRYKYEDYDYEVRALQSFSRRYLEKNYKAGREYTVYIDPDRPRNASVRTKPQTADIIVLLIGVACLAMFLIR